jgi:hypothetical protein
MLADGDNAAREKAYEEAEDDERPHEGVGLAARLQRYEVLQGVTSLSPLLSCRRFHRLKGRLSTALLRGG